MGLSCVLLICLQVGSSSPAGGGRSAGGRGGIMIDTAWKDKVTLENAIQDAEAELNRLFAEHVALIQSDLDLVPEQKVIATLSCKNILAIRYDDE